MSAARPLLRVGRLLSIAAAVLAAVTGRVQAQSPAGSDGLDWWAGAGGGYSAGHTACTNCESTRSFRDGYAALFQGGVFVTPRLRLGGELLTAERSDEGRTLRDTYLIAIGQFRPFASAGFFVKGGYGMALVTEIAPLAGRDVTVRTWGLGLMYGAGWAFRECERVSVAPFVATYVTTVGNVRAMEGTAENVVINTWFVGAAVMF